KPGRTMKMRFYSGVRETGEVSHHDLALAQIPDGASLPTRDWSMTPGGIGLNHVAICYPDRQSWLEQIAFLKERGVKFHLRIDHGMTHSVYIADPNGYGIEILHELPREGREHDNAGFRLRGHQLTDAEGRYRLETILPGVYPGRTRHIHVKAQAPSRPALTTQLYFPGEAGNARDGIFDPELLVAFAEAGDVATA